MDEAVVAAGRSRPRRCVHNACVWCVHGCVVVHSCRVVRRRALGLAPGSILVSGRRHERMCVRTVSVTNCVEMKGEYA